MWCMRRSAELSLCFTAPLAWRSLICRLGRRQGRLGRLPFKCVSPLACPALRRNCLQESRARGSATSGVFACLRSALLSAVLPFGQKPAHLVCVALFLNPPETRKVVGNASFPSFSRSVSTDYRLLSRCAKRVVLADKDCVLDSNFLFVDYLKKKIRTDKLFSLHSFITVT